MQLLYYVVFLLYSTMNHLCVFIHSLFFGSVSHLGHHRALGSVPCAEQQVLLSYLSGVYVSVPVSQLIPNPLLPSGVHTVVLCICVSVSALQIGSFVPFSWIPHICGVVRFGKWRFGGQVACQFPVVCLLTQPLALVRQELWLFCRLMLAPGLRTVSSTW